MHDCPARGCPSLFTVPIRCQFKRGPERPRPHRARQAIRCLLFLSSSVLSELTHPRTEYAQLCGEDITAQAVLRWDGGSEAASNATLQGREFLPSACLYGVPDIATSPLAILKSSRRAWPFVAVAVLMVLFVSERRFHK